MDNNTFGLLFWCGIGLLFLFCRWLNKRINLRVALTRFIYSKARPTMLRLEELRKQYDGVDDLETMVSMVQKNPDLDIFVYINYTPFAGGENKECRIPVKPNTRMWLLLCEHEKKRLYKELGEAQYSLKLPFHD